MHNSTTIYAGSVFALSCHITLDTKVAQNKDSLLVNATWTRLDGQLTNETTVENTQYTSRLVFNTIRMIDAGNYSCQANVSHRTSTFVKNGMNASETIIMVQGTVNTFLDNTLCRQFSSRYNMYII